MSVEPDLTRIVRSWLRTDEHESASRVLNDVLALLDATPQRRPMRLARRTADMNGYVKLAIAAAAVAKQRAIARRGMHEGLTSSPSTG
jgi:hypothetical protein